MGKYVATTGRERRDLVAASAHLDRFDGPVRVVWAADDRLMPIEDGRRLAAEFPNSRFDIVEDSYTPIPLDQPERLAWHIRELAGRKIESASQTR